MPANIDIRNMESIGNIIRLHRKKAGISRATLGMIAGVGKTVIYDIEHGKKTLRLETVMKIFNALNIRMLLDSPLMDQLSENK